MGLTQKQAEQKYAIGTIHELPHPFENGKWAEAKVLNHTTGRLGLDYDEPGVIFWFKDWDTEQEWPWNLLFERGYCEE